MTEHKLATCLWFASGAEMACSWCKDRFRMCWQIVPKVLMEGPGHPDPETRHRVFGTMMGMVKIDHAGSEAVLAGEQP